VEPAGPSHLGFPLGEDQLVAAIRKVLSANGPGVAVGIGDDAAVVKGGTVLTDLVLTTDMLVEGVHFDRALSAPRDLGHKAIVVNVSDVAAMAASARYALVSLALTPEVEPAWVMELYGGMLTACDEYALSLVGGDLSRGGQVVIGVTVTGEVERGRGVLRSGAQVGDRIVVTGFLGASAGGLVVARAPGAARVAALSTEWGRELLRAHERPVARVGEARSLAQAGATAMMDISDGLAKDLSRLCKESRIGARVELAEVPVAPQLEELARVIRANPLTLALTGGEDYELLATLGPQSVAPARAALAERFGVPLADVGEIIEEGFLAVEPSGTEVPLEPKGWDHFERG
jgi:thiamine-monophosphate kinase